MADLKKLPGIGDFSAGLILPTAAGHRPGELRRLLRLPWPLQWRQRGVQFGTLRPQRRLLRENCPHDQFPECSIVACTVDAGASCVYPPPGTLCDRANETCTGSTLNVGQCDGMGTCNLGNSLPCPNNYACNDAGMRCNYLCESDIDCATGYSCVTKNGPTKGQCLPQSTDGG